jgi:hypothetical protein
LLKGSHKKVAYALAYNVQKLLAGCGLERVGFLTLTFADHVTENAEASRRWKSLRTHVLNRFAGWIAVRERQKSGRLHFHVLLVMSEDIRTGANFTEFAQGRYSSANEALRKAWAFWRETAPKYGFGRTELLPCKSNAEGLSRYLGKYISKNIESRIEADKSARLVMYSRSLTAEAQEHLRPNDFAWNSKGAWLWRKKLAKVAERCGFKQQKDFKEFHGHRWAFHLAERVRSENHGGRDSEGFTVTHYPTGAHAARDGVSGFPGDSINCVIRTRKSADLWADDLSAWCEEMGKAMAFARLKRHVELFDSPSGP